MVHLSTKLRWGELSIWQRAGVVLLSVTQLALLAAALLDIRHRPATATNGNKRWWTAAAFVKFVGPLAYYLLGRKRAYPGASSANVM